jgi:hypothetical protein
MANKDLFKQAIADAKSIREAAIANAKLALEESLTPQLKELLAQRLAEMEEEETPAEEALEEVIGSDGFRAVAEAEEEGEEMAGEEDEEEKMPGEEEAEGDPEESEDEAGEEVGEMSIEELKDVIRDIFQEVMGDQEAEREDGLEANAQELGGEDMTAAATDAEINIEEIMAELAEINNPNPGHGNVMGEKVDELAEAAVKTVMEGLKETTHKYLRAMAEARGCSMEELVKGATRLGALSEMSKVSSVLNNMAELGEAAFMEAIGKLIPAEAAAPVMEQMYDIGDPSHLPMAGKVLAMALTPIAILLGLSVQAVKEKLAKGGEEAAQLAKDGKKAAELAKAAEEKAKEASSGMDTLREELNQTNLLNAKLLYVNKVFKANNLTESQKVSIITAFDKAETVKEVKLVYETVSENITSVGKKEVVKEAKGFASAAVGRSTKPEVITEANAAVLRMQKLAGIIK